MTTKPKKRRRDILFGGPDDESLNAATALDYLHDKYADSDEPPVGTEELVAKYRRKRFELEVFETAVSVAWDSILSHLEDEYAGADPLGLEDLEDEFNAKAAKVLLRLARGSTLPYQCELVEVQTWTFDGARWRRRAA